MTDKINGLEALASKADQLQSMDQEQPQGGEGQGAPEALQPVAATNAEIIAGSLQALREVLAMVVGLKSLQVTMADDKTQELGRLWGAVADKRGYDLNRFMGDYATEVAAVVGTVVIGKVVLTAANAELAAQRPPEKEPAAAGEVVAG